MKNTQQQELCRLIDEFNANQTKENFQILISQLFRCPLLFPMMEKDGKREFVMVEKENKIAYCAFSDMEEAKKSKLENIAFAMFNLEEYSKFVADSNAESLIINLSSEKNCSISRKFFKEVVCTAFEENRIMPALQSNETQEYFPVFKMPFVIGRSEQADLTLENNTINELHSIIIERDKKYFIIDKGSLNGVYVNGQKLESEVETPLVFDDVVEFCDLEYTFVPLGFAQRELPSLYQEEDIVMIANGMYVMQYRMLPGEFYNKTEDFLKTMETEDMNGYHRYFFMSLEMACSIREKELQINEEEVVKNQRGRMINKGRYIFQEKDYGFRKLEQENMQLYEMTFPKVMHVAELSSKIYFLINEAGEKAMYALVLNTEGKTNLSKIDAQGQVSVIEDVEDVQEKIVKKIVESGV